ncbi:hypothetical protein [Shouchella shacheensis]|nr:hypothetical protein [Shouchella shacheensis]
MAIPENSTLYETLGFLVYEEYDVHKPDGAILQVASMEKKLIERAVP